MTAEPVICTFEDFPAVALGTTRTIRICLPNSYNAGSDRRYPVLYLHDGQNLFADQHSHSGHAWHIHRIAAELMHQRRIEEIILVAIDHGDSARLAEFAHHDGAYGGQRVAARGEAYAAFLINALKPFIDRHFLTRPQADQTALLGSSMGGLVSLNIALRHPDVFARVAALSPSCWWAPAELQADLKRYLRALKSLRLWLDIGGREGDFGRYVPAVARRIRTLLGPDQRTFQFHLEPTAGHCETDWGARVHLPLAFLFPRSRISG